jgi:hypothetical protein
LSSAAIKKLPIPKQTAAHSSSFIRISDSPVAADMFLGFPTGGSRPADARRDLFFPTAGAPAMSGLQRPHNHYIRHSQ